MVDERLERVTKSKERLKDNLLEADTSDFDWQEIPLTYRIALHISNHLLAYIPLVFLFGTLVGIFIAGC